MQIPHFDFHVAHAKRFKNSSLKYEKLYFLPLVKYGEFPLRWIKCQRWACSDSGGKRMMHFRFGPRNSEMQ